MVALVAVGILALCMKVHMVFEVFSTGKLLPTHCTARVPSLCQRLVNVSENIADDMPYLIKIYINTNLL